MKKHLFLLALILAPLGMAAENYFVEGAKWTIYGSSPKPETFTLEGTEFKAGYECHNLYRTLESGERILATVVRAEGDKVYFLHDPDETEWDLLYDFGLEEGEECEVSWLYELLYSSWPNWLVENFTREKLRRKVVCTKKTTLPEFGGATVLYIEDVDAKAKGEEPLSDRNFWIVGMGNPYSVDINCDYHVMPVGVGGLMTFDVNGEEIYRYYRREQHGESAFFPNVVWTLDVDGFKGDGKFFKDFYVHAGYYDWNDDNSLVLYKPVEITRDCYDKGGYENKAASYIRVDGDQIYRIKYKKDVPTGLAYDFAMQPGDVREVVALESVAGTPSTWVKCTERRASTAFPGRDEILLDEYADADCTEPMGQGMWITGIGSLASPLANSRFAETGVGSQIKMVSQFDDVMWDRDVFGAPSLANLETVDAGADAAPAVYYNLQGMRVNSPANGVFIRVADGKTSKVLLK